MEKREETHRNVLLEARPIYTSVTLEDFAKIAARAGCHATVRNSGDMPHLALTQGRRAFQACMDAPALDPNLYSVIDLQAELTLPQTVSDAAIARVNSTMRFVQVGRTGRRTVRIHMALVLDGGVTAAWLEQSLQHWMLNWRACERQLQDAVAPTRPQQTWLGAELVH